MRIRGYAAGTPCWSELRTSDPTGSIEFYHELFGWKPVGDTGGPRVDFHLRDMAVAGLSASADIGTPSAWLTYVATDDTAATVDATARAGGVAVAPAVRHPDRGVSALVADPQGAVFGLWQRGPFPGAQVTAEPGTICWNELATRDVAGAGSFYGTVFGWTARASAFGGTDGYQDWLRQTREVAGLIEMGERYPPQVPAHWRTTFEVDDCATAVQRCSSLGGQITFGPYEAGPGTYAQLTDPLGASFGIIAVCPEYRASLG
ncbi:VOC family protein [Micromonospora sp. NBC_01813]|uniref:VOC family protein n=1 Tax=Micromonospora sp. NBC_01813 TaxID=2975988 RepID=UPI002DD9F25E|nr:VOC family protein [Micromonospora sp. NBC_01813]WSA11071.1 VOC family protein [Micromonospora sp. NBC_01813]